MKKQTAWLLFLFVLLTAGSLEEKRVYGAEPRKATVIVSSLKVYANASPRAAVKSSLKKYTVVYVSGTAPGGWSEIQDGSRRAYVATSGLKLAPSPQQTVVVAFGDSNTEGTNWQTNRYASSEKWVTKLQSQNHYDAENAGKGGDTTISGKNRFQKDVLNKHPDVVTIMFGTNDAVIGSNGQARVSKAQFESNIRYFTKTLRARGVRVILMTTPPVVQGYYYERYDEKLYSRYKGARQWHDSYNAIVRKIAKEEKVTLLDNYARMTASLPSVTDRALIESGWFDSSGTHLTPKGSQVIYESVNRLLR